MVTSARRFKGRPRWLLVVLSPMLWAGPGLAAEQASGRAGAPSAKPGPDPAYRLRFPLARAYAFTDTFGAPRPGRRSHVGIDIPAPKLAPVFAVADGRVSWMHATRGGRCCALELVHDDGWRSRYIHLNNDSPGTDDGQGYGIVAGLQPDTWVPAGTLIGWVGDSGNAERTIPHLHFELHAPGRRAVNSYAILSAAMQALAEEPDEDVRVVATERSPAGSQPPVDVAKERSAAPDHP